MRKLKKLKWILTSVVLLGILTAGTSFAISDAGAELQSWYNARFQDNTEEIEKSRDAYFESEFRVPLESYTNELIEESTVNLDKFAARTYKGTNAVIHAVSGRYLQEIWDKKDELLSVKLKQDFNDYIAAEKANADIQINQLVIDFLEDFNSDCDAIITDMDSVIQSNSQESSNELSMSINNAKEDIDNTIDEAEDLTVDNIKAYMDDQVAYHTSEIEGLADNLVIEQVAKVTDRSQDIEAKATQEMDAVILDITNN